MQLVAKLNKQQVAGRVKNSPGRSCLALAFALVVFASNLYILPVCSAEEPQLKPDVPKLDTLQDSPDRSTLKGTVEQRANARPAPRKRKLNSALNSRSHDDGLAGPLKARTDTASPLKGKTQDLSSELKDEFTLDRSVGIIGVKFYKLIHGPAVINRVFAGTPAGKNGLQVNDMIVAVDGVPTQNLSKDQCYDLIVGSPNTPVTLSVMRGGGFEVKQLIRMDFNDIPDPAVRRDYLRSL